MEPRQILKIAFAVLFVLAISFFTAKGCTHFRKPGAPTPPTVVKTPLPTPVVVPKPATPQMAIILDDWGNNLVLVKTAVAIHRPLTLSVLPHLVHSRQIAQEAKKNGLGVMLHMPMQPKNPKEPMEPHTILTTSSEAEIIGTLDKALENIGVAEGVNNHQGSAATSDERLMRTVLRHLKSRGLFFVDSEVIPTTVGRKVSRETGIQFTKRDVFIDNTHTVDAIKEKLRQAGKIAVKYGRVVVIGHDKKLTLQAIREMVPELEKSGVKFVLVKELVE